ELICVFETFFCEEKKGNLNSEHPQKGRWTSHHRNTLVAVFCLRKSQLVRKSMEATHGGEKGKSRLCSICNQRRPALKRPKTLQQLKLLLGIKICKECFYEVFEEEIHRVIVDNKLFKPGERIAIGASGGKDSTVLAYVMSELNRRHNYGLDLFLLSVDEGITGYRDDSLETVKRNEVQYGLPLKVVSYKDLYGWTMDEIVKMIGLKNNCTFCGVFRRQALDRGAALLKVDKLATGHNADDIAETVLLNILRGDIARLSRCTSIITGEDGPIPRCKPFKYTYEKEIVIYPSIFWCCKTLTIGYVCILQETGLLFNRIPRAILDIIKSGEDFRIATSTKMPEQGTCQRCGYISSQKWCKACVLLEGLNRGLPKLGIGRTRGVNSKHQKDDQQIDTKNIQSKPCGTLDF
ncbi:Rossmann-like alpha/beta/alpha sandwich fold, partial [Cynara cardunculus var. scolymus]